MRISKNRDIIKAQVSDDTSINKYDDAIHHIKEAIDVLGKVAKGDSVAKEAIANLGVVILDLKS